MTTPVSLRELRADVETLIAAQDPEVIVRGVCYLRNGDGEFLMSAPGTAHSLHRSCTDAERLLAHWVGFLENHGVEVVRPPPSLESLPVAEIKRRLRRERAKAEADLASPLRETRKDNPRATLRGRDVEVIGCNEGRIEACVWYFDFEDMSRGLLDLCASYSRARGATTLWIGHGLDHVYDRFESDSDYEPFVAEYGFDLSL